MSDKYLNAILAEYKPVHVVSSIDEIEVILEGVVRDETVIILKQKDEITVFYGAPDTGDRVAAILQCWQVPFTRANRYSPIYIE